MNEEEQPERTIIRNPPADMEFSLTPEAEAELAAANAEEPQAEETPTRPSRAEIAAYQAGQAAGRTGAGIGRFLGGIGATIESGKQSDNVSDDISDLFEGPDMERDNDVYVKDLVTVDEEDAMGEGDPEMKDLLEVDEEDIMGEAEEPTEKRQVKRKYTAPRQQPLPRGLMGMR